MALGQLMTCGEGRGCCHLPANRARVRDRDAGVDGTGGRAAADRAVRAHLHVYSKYKQSGMSNDRGEKCDQDHQEENSPKGSTPRFVIDIINIYR